MNRIKWTFAAVVLLAAVVMLTFALHADNKDVTLFGTRLTGFGEVPPRLVDGHGTFAAKLSEDGNSISWKLTWTGLTGPAQVAHIHFGQPQNTGMPVVFFCGGGNRPAACPDGPGHSGSLSGTFDFHDVVAVPSQGVAAGNFAGFVKILRAGLGYANIHTTQFPAGEIRGQVRVDEGDPDE